MKKIFTNILLLSLTMIIAALPQAKAQTTISTGDMVITSKLMTFHNGIYVARGGIKAEQKDSTMTADRGIYDQELEVVKAIDNVKVTQPDTVLTADYLEAYPKEDRLLARGNPKVTRIIERNKNKRLLISIYRCWIGSLFYYRRLMFPPLICPTVP